MHCFRLFPLLLIPLYLGLVLAPLAVQANQAPFPPQHNFQNQTLHLNGTGISYQFFMAVHTSGLYLQQPSQDRKAIREANEPMAIRLQVTTRIVTRGLMTHMIMDQFSRATNGDTSAVQKQLDQIFKAFSDPIKKWDIYDFIWQPSTQELVFLHNGNEKLRLPGLEFKRIFFTIWLGDNPSEPHLQRGILGIKS